MKRMIRALTPPAAVEIYRAIFRRGIQFRGKYPDWASAERHAEGYDAMQILEKVRLATREVASGNAACERDSVVFDVASYPFPVIALLLRSAFENSGWLNVLDFGGALGSSYYQSRDFLDGVPTLNWSVVEQPNFAECGRREFQNDVLSFYEDVESAARAAPPNVILASGVLQYIRNPGQVLQSFVRTGADYIVIDRTPFVRRGSNIVSVQTVPSAISRSSYPVWLFEKGEFLSHLVLDYDEVASFPAVDGALGTGSLKADFLGFIFKKKGLLGGEV